MAGKAVRETLGFLAVVAGLVFVGLELRQNTDMMRSQTRSEVTQSILTLIEMERHPELVEAQLRRGRGEDVTAEQRYLLENMANATLRVWENTYYQYSADLFDEEEFQADLRVWEAAMAEPEFIDLWSTTRETYSRRFREVMDGLVPGGP